jgi:hypothetical protein
MEICLFEKRNAFKRKRAKTTMSTLMKNHSSDFRGSEKV